MIKKEYLITLLDLYHNRTARVWEELESNNLLEFTDIDFKNYLKTIIKDKRKNTFFNNAEINKAIEKTLNIIRFCEENNIQILSFEDYNYPKEKMDKIILSERPIILYAFGNISILKEEGLAIIGSRETDEEYFEIAVELGKNLSYKYVINSGLAIGSDTGGHKGALLGTGKTIAILANGLDTIYPAVNRKLAKEIVEKGGLLLTEYPPFTKVLPYYFANRDRLQAALSSGIIVVETGVKSGTMITVNYTKKYNKALFVVKPLTHEKKYNDKGNYELLKSPDTISINEDITVNEITELLEKSKKQKLNFENNEKPKQKTKKVMKKYVWKIIEDLFFKSYQLGNNAPVEEIPKKYKIISRTKTEVITELEVTVISDD